MSFVAHIHPGKASWVRFSNWRMEKKKKRAIAYWARFALLARDNAYFKWMGSHQPHNEVS
ncbi:hypothetical protein OUZ56_010848 [Daphnia magna]|uniref:Uncharacterized protein n=1 Tax=Daphnia magna TaxID=35525 RepID=A0ABQ9YZZ1_9CRUS|nr:hypothetical protein OUZ56_010848 [Daphnia magna]